MRYDSTEVREYVENESCARRSEELRWQAERGNEVWCGFKRVRKSTGVASGTRRRQWHAETLLASKQWHTAQVPIRPHLEARQQLLFRRIGALFVAALVAFGEVDHYFEDQEVGAGHYVAGAAGTQAVNHLFQDF